MSKMDSVVSTSKKAGSYLDKEPDKIISHGIDLNRFSLPEDKDKAWQALGFPGSIGIGIFGRVRYSKGIDILVDAALKFCQTSKSYSNNLWRDSVRRSDL